MHIKRSLIHFQFFIPIFLSFSKNSYTFYHNSFQTFLRLRGTRRVLNPSAEVIYTHIWPFMLVLVYHTVANVLFWLQTSFSMITWSPSRNAAPSNIFNHSMKDFSFLTSSPHCVISDSRFLWILVSSINTLTRLLFLYMLITVII